MGDTGLITILPFTYFISLSMLSVVFILCVFKDGERKILFLFLQVILLIFILHATPPLVEENVRFTATYKNYRAVDYIRQKGYINTSKQWIHNWPSFSILYSVLIQLATFPEDILLKFYPTFFNVILSLFLFAFFNMVSKNGRITWFSLWIFHIANWIGQDYFSMQSLGLSVYVLVILSILKAITQTRMRKSWVIIFLLLFYLVVTSHALSSIVILLAIFTLLIFRRLKRLVLAINSIIIFSSWSIYGAITYLQWNMKKLIFEALDFNLVLQKNIFTRISGSSARIFVTQIRIIFSLFFIFFAFLSIILLVKNKKFGEIEKRNFFLLLSIIPILGLFSYGGELFMRIYLFSLIFISYFISLGLNKKMFFYTFIVFLVAAPPLHILARYGNEIIDYVPSSEVRCVQFLYNVTKRGYIILSPDRDLIYRETYKIFKLWGTEWKNNVLSLGYIEEDMKLPKFICLTYGTWKYYVFFLGNEDLFKETRSNLTKSLHYNKFYSNDVSEIYIEI